MKLLNNRLSQFQNHINILDQQLSKNKFKKNKDRENIKIAVIFVGKNQSLQGEILKNTSGSPYYDKFINNLGKKNYTIVGESINLMTHLGFFGGLKDPNDGKSTIYFSNAFMEIIYHVATIMPTDETDEQQISKKRHIGNDHVTIVWTENCREYRRYTISSQFNCVIIVIYPLTNNLFRINILKKDSIPKFFPWIDEMVLPFDLLCPLVRLTAINAFRKARSIAAKGEAPEVGWSYQNAMARGKLIEDIINNYEIKQMSFDLILENLLSN